MKVKLKVVFDTNIFISAIIFGGNPRQCLELARKEQIRLFVSKSILLEFVKKLKEKFLWPDSDIKEVILGTSEFAQIVVPKDRIDIIKEDPEDNRILEAAKEGKVDYIISGDKRHLLSLKKFEGIPIVSANAFLKIFYES